MVTQENFNNGGHCRSKGFCFLCKDTSGCVEYVNTEIKEKPPLGIMPKYIWDNERINNLKEAIDRYVNAKIKVPLNGLMNIMI